MNTLDRFAPTEASEFGFNGWQGIKADVICGVSDEETGFHAAGGSCLWAVLSNGKRSVVVDTQGLIGNDARTFHILETLKFD